VSVYACIQQDHMGVVTVEPVRWRRSHDSIRIRQKSDACGFVVQQDSAKDVRTRDWRNLSDAERGDRGGQRDERHKQAERRSGKYVMD